MFSVFNYNTLDVSLERSTRSLRVNLKRNSQANAINMEMLFELESLFAWLSNKVEIHSLFISSQTENFSCGLDQNFIAEMTQKQIEKLNAKLQKIIFAMFHLPQTIIMDLREGSQNIASELSLGADIRLANVNAKVAFDHAAFGLVPGAAGMGVLCELTGVTFAKNMLLTGKSMNAHKLIQAGFLFDTYDATNREETINDLLQAIHRQAPVSRIQTKLGTFEPRRENIEKAMTSDKQIFKAALMAHDWKETKSRDFMPPKSLSYAVKLSLVKNSDQTDIMN
jgi:enoyl-CoA hydratase